MRDSCTLAVPHPGHAGDSANGEVRKFVECRGRKVEISQCAACASVSERDRDTLALIGGCDSPSAKRVLVGVDTVVTREVVEQQVGYSSNMISVRVRNSTGAQAGGVESALAGLGTNQKAWQVATSTARCALGSSRRSSLRCGMSSGWRGCSGRFSVGRRW
jgi:hypothetical protein